MSMIVDTESVAEPIILPRLSENEVERINALVGTTRVFPFTWADQPAVFQFTPAGDAPVPTGWVRVRLGDHRFHVGLPQLPELSSWGPHFAGIEIAALPEEIVGAVLEAWLRDPIDALEQQGVALEVDAWVTAPLPEAADLGWQVSGSGGEPFLAGTVSASAGALSYLASLAHRHKPQLRESGLAVPLVCQVAAASQALPVATLRTLAVGDVVVTAAAFDAFAEGQGEFWLGGRRVGSVRREGAIFKIFSMNTVNEPKTSTGAGGPMAIDELPVQLLFEVGQIELPIGQLRSVAVGFVFGLPAARERLVTIRANGREVGQGELVEIGEKVGVRILSWNLS